MSTPRLTYRCPHCGSPLELEARTSDELLTCPSPACGKPFKAEVPTATPVNPLILPADAREPSTDGGDDRPASSIPVAEPVAEHEDRIQIIHLDMFRRYPFRCLTYGGIAIAGLLGLAWFGFRGQPLWATLSAVAAGLALYRLVPWWLRMRNTVLTITSKRCVVEAGVFSKDSQNFPLDDVNEIEVNQGLLSRFLNVGDIVLSSNGGEKRQVVLMAIPDPGRVAEHMRTRH